MTADEAYRRLVAKGCQAKRFFINSRGEANDAIGLVKRQDLWEVFYTERGIDSPPMFTSRNEAEAAEYFYDTISGETHWHLVGFFELEEEARALEAQIKALGITPIRNDIPNFEFQGAPRFRVFVEGEDIFVVREFLDDKPPPLQT